MEERKKEIVCPPCPSLPPARPPNKAPATYGPRSGCLDMGGQWREAGLVLFPFSFCPLPFFPFLYTQCPKGAKGLKEREGEGPKGGQRTKRKKKDKTWGSPWGVSEGAADPHNPLSPLAAQGARQWLPNDSQGKGKIESLARH